MVITILSSIIGILAYILYVLIIDIRAANERVAQLYQIAQNLNKLYHEAAQNQCQCPKEN